MAKCNTSCATHTDNDWTHTDTMFSRLSYIDKTALPDDSYYLHFCTFKPWRVPAGDKWIHERWEDNSGHRHLGLRLDLDGHACTS